MENNEQQPQPEAVEQSEQVVEEAVEAVQSEQQEAPAERPEANYKAEIERRKANEERLRQELETERSKQVKRFDVNDVTTWSENDLNAVRYSQDPNHLQYKAAVEDEIFERKMRKAMDRERQNQRRISVEAELKTKYPESLDAGSEFAAKMEQVMYDLDLQKSPAGRLAAARIVAAENQKGTGQAKAAGRKQEEARLKDVKQTLSEGDRPDPRGSIPNPNKEKEVLSKLNSRNLNDQAAAMNEILNSRGLDRANFFKK